MNIRERINGLKQDLSDKKAEARSLHDAKKLDEAEAVITQCEEIRQQIADLEKQDEQEQRLNNLNTGGKKTMENNNPEIRTFSSVIASDEYSQAFYKSIRNKRLTPEEEAILAEVRLLSGATATNSTGLPLPQDINVAINEAKRQYKSLKTLVGNYPTNTLTGQFTFEDSGSMTELVNFDDGEELEEQEPKFRTVSYALKNYGAITKISNSMLQDEASAIRNFLASWFAKKAIKTENSKGFAKLKEGKVAKDIVDWKALKKSVNKDLDPVVAVNAIIVTNQDGFDVLDSALDGQGRPVLQPNPTNPTQMLFMGKPIYVFSNAELPTAAGKAPILYGNLVDALWFIDRNVYELGFSEHAGFTSNTTVARVVERFDLVKADADAYVYGEITIA